MGSSFATPYSNRDGFITGGPDTQRFGFSTAVSANGKVVVGDLYAPGATPPYVGDSFGPPDSSRISHDAFRWTAASGEQILPSLPHAMFTNAVGTSADGSLVIGYSDGKPVEWTSKDNFAQAHLLDVNGDVRQVLAGQWAFLYQDHGMEMLKQYLTKYTDLGSLIKDYTFLSAVVSPDGRAIAGGADARSAKGYEILFDSPLFGAPGPSPGGSGDPGATPAPEPSSLLIAIAALAFAVGCRLVKLI